MAVRKSLDVEKSVCSIAEPITDSVVTPAYMKGGVPEATAMVTYLRENLWHLFDRSVPGNS